MKHLKIFESKTCKEYFDELNSKTGVNEIVPEIDELFLDLKDEFDVDFDTTNDIWRQQSMVLTCNYKRQRERKTNLGYFYYKDLFQSGKTPTKTETDRIEDFIKKCEIAVNISFKYLKIINFKIKSEEEFERVKSEINNTLERGRSLGYKVSFSFPSSTREYENSIFLGDFRDWDSYDEESTTRIMSICFVFQGEIDKSRLLLGDPTEGLPKNILTDFNDFTNKLRISQSDKQTLINIIKRGDWSSPS